MLGYADCYGDPMGGEVFTLSVTGGKGGTGKSTVAVNLAVLFMLDGYRVLLVDCDVCAPNAALLLETTFKEKREVTIFSPRFVASKCSACGVCVNRCRAHALIQPEGKPPLLFPELCKGCKLCMLVCPAGAVEEERRTVGFVKEFSYKGLDIVSGELLPNEKEAGPVMVSVRRRVEKLVESNSYDVVIVDTAPGIHCEVVRALEMTRNALAVTEPTPLGAYDLEIILRLASLLGVRPSVVINKADVGDVNLIRDVCEKMKVDVVAEIPFDVHLFACYAKSVPVVIGCPSSPSARAIVKLYEAVRREVKR